MNRIDRLPALCAVFLTAGVLLLLTLSGVGIASEHSNSPAGNGGPAHDVYLPATLSDYPSEGFTHLELSLSHDVISAGQSVSLTVTTLNDFDEPVYDSFFDIAVTINGRSEHEDDEIPLTSHEDGTYSGVITPTTTGQYFLNATIFDEAEEEPLAANDGATLQVAPALATAIATMATTTAILPELEGDADEAEFLLITRDEFLNAGPPPSSSDVECTSDNADIQPATYGLANSIALAVAMEATAYGAAEFTCEYLPTGHTVTEQVFYAPWEVEMKAEGLAGRGFRTDSFFDVHVGINPPGDGTGWQTVTGTIAYEGASGVDFEGCEDAFPNFEVACVEEPGAIHFAATALSSSGVSEPAVPFTMSFTTPATPTEIVEDAFTVADLNLYDTTFSPIAYDAAVLEPVILFPFAVKPTKELTMSVYIVEGAATNDDVVEDVEQLEVGLNANAFLCHCDYYIDIDLVTTTIPITDWRKIDEQGNGLDRLDRDGDGEYDGKGEYNDLDNAKDEGYFDDGDDTENVYYVPGISSGALGVTYSPDGQIGVDNDADHDNLTLFHEKVHELDLRKDGDFDVHDSPDDPNNDQGARDPDNIMNYEDTGYGLTPEQCEELF
ncbi:MAG: hypothetical protein ACOC9V_06790 [Chloroflexota bacterium]